VTEDKIRRMDVCTYHVEKVAIVGGAKGPRGWMKVDTAVVYYDHPQHIQLEHALNIDFADEAGQTVNRLAVELSAESARRLVEGISAALARDDVEPVAAEA
jgi:hypothetical protein